MQILRITGMLLLLGLVAAGCNRQISSGSVKNLSSLPPAAADEIIPWSELKNGEVQRVRADASGRYLAALYGKGEVEVWALRDGILDEKIWLSREKYSNSRFLDFVWLDQDLILSREYISTNVRQGNGDEDTPRIIYSNKGNTLRLDVETGNGREFLPSAGRQMALDTTGKYLAAANPLGRENSGASVDFYDLAEWPAKVKKLGGFQDKDWDAFGKSIPYIIDWVPDGSGVYVVARQSANRRKGTSQVLYFISRTGVLSEVLSQSDSLINDSRQSLPLSFITQRRNLVCHALFLEQSDFLLLIEGQNVKTKISTKDIMDVVRSVMPTAQLIALSPNERFMLLQDAGKQGYMLRGEMSKIWLVDLKLKLRRQIAISPPVREAFGWAKDGLIFRCDIDNNEEQGADFGMIRLDATLLDESLNWPPASQANPREDASITSSKSETQRIAKNLFSAAIHNFFPRPIAQSKSGQDWNSLSEL